MMTAMNPFQHLNAAFIDACGRLVQTMEKNRFGTLALLGLASLLAAAVVAAAYAAHG
jgi:hypothetical protein